MEQMVHNEAMRATEFSRQRVEGQSRLSLVVDLVREMSLQTDPQTLVNLFRRRALDLYGFDRSVSLSRRGLEPPYYRITRSTTWKEDINPWEEPHRLPVFKGGLLGELLYADEPRILDDVTPSPDDPAYEFLKDARSFISLPQYDGGVALNMVVRMSRRPSSWDANQLADVLLEANLFGRATHHLLVTQRLQKAYAELDHELKRVAEIQRALLPPRLPSIPGVDIAASYQTARRAGGDYYDFFQLGDGRWGLLIADVSGHGTPAAVIMAMLRTMLHGQCHQCLSPAQLLSRANAQLCDRTDLQIGSFVTAFYGIFDPGEGSLHYTCAGHPPPLLVDRSVNVCELDEAQTLPLAVSGSTVFPESSTTVRRGDTLLLYTDGITEAVNQSGELYGRERLLSCVREDVPNAQHIIDCVTYKLLGFTHGLAQQDDQTLVALRVKDA
jgi:sigma-B regulation protein RsbU (phosphoserine phosphatase)